MLIAAIIIAFIYEWRLALMMLGVAPLSCFTMALMARVSTKFPENHTRAIAFKPHFVV